jgi:acyl-CoA dehydrogenase
MMRREPLTLLPADPDLITTVERFAREAILPHVEDWEAACGFPRALYKQAADLGLLAMGYEERVGGIAASWISRLAVMQVLSRVTGAGGVTASLFSHNIAMPLVQKLASDDVAQEIIPPVLRGERIAALAITEPSGGSDVARLRTTAQRQGSDYVVDGEKVFITSGVRADWYTVAVRTGEGGARGISLLSVRGDAQGVSRTPLQKMGWHSSDTAHVRFDQVRVPARYLLGQESQGFREIMANFNGERLVLAAGCLGAAQCALDEALDWAQQRQTFGASLVNHQVVRHKLVDMQMRIRATEHWLIALATALDETGVESPEWVAEVCLLKNQATTTLAFCADAAVQTLGGMGFMRGTKSERIYREVKVNAIGGGTEEIMKELAAKQMGWL